MIRREILTRVADGLRQAARERGVSELYREDLKFFEWVCDRNPDLLPYLNSPSIDISRRYQAVDDIFGRMLVPEVIAFIKILMRDGIIDSFPAIRAEFNRLADEDSNIAQGEVFTPFELDAGQLRRLERAFSRKLDRRVILEQVQDRSLLAGIRVILMGKQYEYSVDNLLDGVRDSALRALKEGAENG